MFHRHHLLTRRRLIFIHQVPGEIHNLGDGHRRDALSAIGQGGIGSGHFQQRNVSAAQRQGQPIIIAGEGGDAQALGNPNQPFRLSRGRVVIHVHKRQGLYRGDII